MNSGIRVSDLEKWRSCLGCCMICGQPMGIRKSAYTSKETDSLEEENEANKLGIVGSQSESILLTPECPIRLVMVGFNILGVRQNCHLVDQYTFLEKKNVGASFKDQFEKWKETILTIHPLFSTFQKDIEMTIAANEKTTEYDIAAATCKRVADGTTFSGCVLCNKAMDRDIMHINAVYRCFSVTKDADIPLFESNTKDSIAIKKVLQQIALYFVVPTGDTPRWKAKSGENLLVDGALWRCIAHLCTWGQSKQFRFRLIAIFHAAHYIYLKSSLNGSLEFEDWHLHIFRDFYMNKFQDPNTWFGLTLKEISPMFDLSQKWGDKWISLVKGRLEVIGDALEIVHDSTYTPKISFFKDRVVKYVNNERSLINFVCSKKEKIDYGNLKQGLDRFLYFFKYNIGSPGEIVLLKRCEKFESEICKTIKALRTK